MPRYEAKVIATYWFEVEADSEEEAKQEALNNFDELSTDVDYYLKEFNELGDDEYV